MRVRQKSGGSKHPPMFAACSGADSDLSSSSKPKTETGRLSPFDDYSKISGHFQGIRRRQFLHVLIFCIYLLFLQTNPVNGFRKPRGRLLGQSLLPFGYNFEFTRPEYNISLKENTRNKAFVQQELDSGEKIGVYLPPVYSKVKYKIVDGDKDKLFTADSLVFGDFAFLQIMPVKGEILNRERKSNYELLIKATMKRKNANTLETTSKVNLRILDENDNSPMFRKIEYSVEIDTDTPPNSRLIKLEAFDADEGLNAEIYYSMTNPANDSSSSKFYVDSKSGWIRSFSRLVPGNYTVDCFVEDRTSRLQFHALTDSPKPGFIRNTAKALITVTETSTKPMKFSIQKLPLKMWHRSKQLAARVTVENVETGSVKMETRSNQNVWIEQDPETLGFAVFVGKTTNLTVSAEIISTTIFESSKKLLENITFDLVSTRKIEFEGFSKFIDFSVNESVPLGFVIHQFQIHDLPEEEHNLVRFRLRTEAKDFPFTVDRLTGQLKVKNPLDFELLKNFEFSIVAKIEGYDDVKTSALCRIQVLDSNDNCPKFTKLRENNRIILASGEKKSKVFQFKASDADSGDNGKIYFKLKGPAADYFEIDSNTGQVTVAKQLDKKSIFWVVTVVAFDAGFPASLSSEAVVQIFLDANEMKKATVSKNTVTDACGLSNKNPPKFAKVPENVKIFEDAPVKTVIGHVLATDQDYGINGLVQYTTDDEYFTVDLYSGKVTVNKNLEPLFDQIHKNADSVNYSFEILATDMGFYVNPKTPSLSTKTTVTVKIEDVNNHEPLFEFDNYFAEIYENAGAGTTLARVKASDKDPGNHGKVEYILGIETELISIDPDTGVVRTEKSFDREISPKTGKFVFLLAAFDRADPSRFGFANLTVTVADENDNSPKCLHEIQEFKMLEDSPSGHLIGCLAATDADINENALLSFNMVKTIPRVPFRVDLSSGCLFLDSSNPLSFDRHSRYSFNVTVSDNGAKPRATVCQVKLDLIKVNQNLMAPEFETVAVEGSVTENSPVGTQVIQVKATDPEGKPVKYELVGGSGLGYFEIDEVSGVIKTSVVLDYEATPSYWLTVEATDADDKPLKGYLSVLVRVLDANDRAPLFEKPIYFVDVEENSPENKVMLKLEAEDADGKKDDNADGHLKFSITKGNTQSLFQIDATTGYLVTGKRHLDRETQQEHELLVRVCDYKSFSLTRASLCTDALVVVTVTDINDNKPLFNATMNLNVQVPANKIGFLTRIFANDADADGPNSDLEYTFVGPLVDERLKIDKYGRISTVEALNNGDQVHVTVLAKDAGAVAQNNSVTLILAAVGRSKKSAVNNKKPKFVEKETWKELFVTDADHVGSTIGVVKAVDDDNDPLWYSISADSENPNETFAFKTSTGELILARSVNLIDPLLKEVKLSLKVSDGVVEVIDNLKIKISREVSAPRPQFESPSDSLTIPSNTPVGMVLYTAKARFDESKTGVSHPHRLIYSIHHIDDVIARDYLRIDPHSGQLVLEKPLTSQVAKNFTVIISAKVGTVENFLQLFVTKEASNEYPPKFISKKFSFGLDSGAAAGMIVGKVKAFDADQDDGLLYSIIAGNEFGFFSVDQKTGDVKTTQILTHLFKESILTVRVSDSGDPQKSSTSVVRIFVQPSLKTVRPVFESESVHVHLRDDAAVDSLVTQVKLISDSTALQTRLVFEDICEYLDIHFINGVVKLRKPLPVRGHDWTLNCTVFAVNEGGNNATMFLVVKIESTLAHSVRFETTVYSTFIEENAAPGSSLYVDMNQTSPLTVKMVQPAGGRGKMKILSPRESHFSIDGVSGAVRVTEPMDFEKHKNWQFYVTSPELISSPSILTVPAVIQVTVLNVNDVPPILLPTGPFEVFLPPISGTKIGSLQAFDGDGGDDVTFGLKPSEFSKLFTMNRTSSDLILTSNKTEDFKKTSFTVPVVASDGLHSVTSDVKITVVDSGVKNVFKNQLKFVQNIYKITVIENSTVSDGNLLSLDLENSEFFEIFKFELLTRNAAFELGETSGILRLIDGRFIDREKTSAIELVVKATSLNEPKKSAVTTVKIDVEDINDSAPIFLNLPYEVLLSEDAASGDKIISVKATDSDLSSNSVVRYSLATDAPKFLDINKFDGKITLNSKPDILKGQQLVFTVIATDTGKPPLEARERVTVKIANKHQPIFTHSKYSTQISESTAVGTTLMSVRASSKSEGGVIGYRIASGDEGHQFLIDFESGQLSVNKNLDKEEKDVYLLSVEAVDVTRNVTGASVIEVSINDVNDSPPVFERLVYDLKVSETASVGSLIGSVKAVDSEGSTVAYSVSEGNKTVISVDSSSGHVYLEAPLDRETVEFYEFTVIARDQDRLSSEAVLQITVTDANDSPPKFFDGSPVKLALNLDTVDFNQFIYQLTADDRDTVSSLTGQRFRFSIIDGDETLFQIDPKNGVIRAATVINVIELSESGVVKKKLNVSVTDGLFQDFVGVEILMRPSKKLQQAPLHFEQTSYLGIVTENRQSGNKSAVMTVSATGGDRPVSYSIAGRTTLPVTVEKNTGKIFLSRPIFTDLEFPISVQDQSGNKAFSKLKLQVKDENDKEPKFIAPDSGYSFCSSTDAQEGESIAVFVAVDEDANDPIEYSLVTTGGAINATKYLEIDQKNGYLVLKKAFTDVKPLPATVEFRVRASDSGNPPHFAQADVKLKIVDVPNVVPQFSRLHYLFATSEDAIIGKSIGQLQAGDDQPGHAKKEISFKVTSSDSGKLPFSVDPKTGKIMLTDKIDRETVEKYNFIVEIRANDGLFSFALVTVAVMDVNDNAPVFSTLYDNVTIPEDTLVGTVIANFVATDADSGSNGHVFYSLAQEGVDNDALKQFQIDREYGWLTVVRPLDREKRSLYQINVVASDEEGKSTSTAIVIQVEDVNDSLPKFEQEKYEVVVSEEKLVPGSVINEFLVSDEDTVGDVRLYITSGDDDGYFYVDDMTLKVKKKLPANVKSYSLEMTASDGIHSVAVLTLVKIQKSAPGKFAGLCKNEQEIKIAGNLNSGHAILKLLSGTSQELVLNHLLDAEKLPFEVKNHSQLVVKNGYNKKRAYKLKIKSRKELKNSVKIEPSCLQIYSILIENANIQAPRFEKKEYLKKVKENVPVFEDKAHFLLQVEAVDEDFGIFGVVRYSILNSTGDDKMFTVHETTGAVLLKKELDHESRDNYQIFVKATDGGGLFDVCKITVVVEDVNDNPPVFEKEVYRLKVLEDEAVGYELLKVQAFDKDAKDKVTYSIQKNNITDFVKLNPESGVFKLNKQLDFEVQKNLTFEVTATDSSKPPLTSKCTVEIEILDVNDNAPRFDKTLYEGKIAENMPVGTKILQIHAIDMDSEHFGKVSYSISGEDSEYFDIDDEGNLVNVKNIDYETKSILRANVKAVDGGQPPLSDDTLLSITVLDLNDNLPHFTDCNMSTIVQEGAVPGHSLLTVAITDKDSGANGGPFKIELKGQGSDSFGFDQDSRLIVIKKLSFEKNPVYHLKATATDSGGKSTTCPIQIEVKKQSTHPPELKPLIIMLNTLHGEFLGGAIGTVKAEDKDAGDTLRYSIVENDDRRFAPSKFSMNPESGQLTALSDLLPGLHRLNVSVTDGKFTEYGRVDVDVANIDQDGLDHAVSLRIAKIGAKKFIKHFMKRFHEILAHLLNVPITDVRFMSIQETDRPTTVEASAASSRSRPGKFFSQYTTSNEHPHRHKREEHTELDVLFTVSRGENHGYHRPTWVRQNIEKQIAELSTESGLEIVSLTSEVCRRDVCVKGECRDRLWLDNAEQQMVYEVDGTAFVSPKHLRTFECLCKQGYSGRHCDVPVNVCSKELCTKHEMCIPSIDEPSGFRCICPPGFKGSQCSEPTCDDPSTCSQKEELSLMGNGFVQLFVANSMETRLELSVQFRTVSNNGVVMHGEGLKDFHMIKVVDGSIEYSWNCGTGPQTAGIRNVKVDDGAWHEFKVARRGRHVRVVLDNVHEADATSPAGSDVVNLFTQATLLTFGGRVLESSYSSPNAPAEKISTKEWFNMLSRSSQKSRQVASELVTVVDEGIVGCFGRISFDGFDLSKTSQGMRLYNAKIGCNTSLLGPCLSSPCKNNGQCLPAPAANTFTCSCPKRYTGASCEIDLNACESKPCPNGIACHNLYNDFHCACPAGFTGKTCQMRGDWDPCVTNPCGPYGSCVRQGASFICNCSGGFGGAYCNERVPNILSDVAFFKSNEIYLIGGLVALILILTIILIICCRRGNRGSTPKKGKPQYNDYDDPLLGNPLLARNSAPPIPPHHNLDRPIMINPSSNAPPLPPRMGRQSSQHIYCNQMGSNLPTVEVRPMQNTNPPVRSSQRFFKDTSCGSPSESSNGKRRHQKRGSNHNYSRSHSNGIGGASLTDTSLERSADHRYAHHRSGDDSSNFSSRQGSSSGINGDVSSSIPLLSMRNDNMNDSIQCLPTHEDIEINLDDDSDVEERNRILEDVRRERETIDTATNSYNHGEPQDYVTMKPIHKIKPFSVNSNSRNDIIKDIDEDSESSKDPVPPPPPAHRTTSKTAASKPAKTKMPTSSSKSSKISFERDRTETTRLYDHPNDDTLSNVTSNGLDD